MFRPAWSPGRAALAGLVGALANSGAIRLLQMLGLATGTGGFSRWLIAHLNALLHTSFPMALGPLQQELFHTGVGVVSALIYAGLFHRLIPGPGWRRGLIYCQAMWLVQGLVVLPYLGAGYFGWRQSRLIWLLTFLLNALYGVVVGALYVPGRRRMR